MSLGIKQIVAIPMSALKGENVVLSGKASMPWYDGPTLVEHSSSPRSAPHRLRLPSACAARVSSQAKVSGLSGHSCRWRGEARRFRRHSAVRMVANVKQIVTFDLVRNAAVAGDAITLVLDRQVDVSRGDMIVSIDAQPQTGLAFDAQIVALQPGGIEPNKRYWLKSGSRRQRVSVQPAYAARS